MARRHFQWAGKMVLQRFFKVSGTSISPRANQTHLCVDYVAFIIWYYWSELIFNLVTFKRKICLRRVCCTLQWRHTMDACFSMRTKWYRNTNDCYLLCAFQCVWMATRLSKLKQNMNWKWNKAWRKKERKNNCQSHSDSVGLVLLVHGFHNRRMSAKLWTFVIALRIPHSFADSIPCVGCRFINGRDGDHKTESIFRRVHIERGCMAYAISIVHEIDKMVNDFDDMKSKNQFIFNVHVQGRSHSSTCCSLPLRCVLFCAAFVQQFLIWLHFVRFAVKRCM